MTRRKFMQVSAAVLALPSMAGSAVTKSAQLPVGMNLAGIADWEPGFPFRNLMWGARLWMTRNVAEGGRWDTGLLEQIPLDGDGYPLELPLRLDEVDQKQIVFTLLPNVRPPGRYVLLFEGDGDFAGVLNTKIVEQKPGRVLLEMRNARYGLLNQTPEQLEGICITRSRRGNHVRNIRIVSAADEYVDLTLDPFLPEFIAFCKPFHVLRFMDWMTTNGSLEKEWSGRKRLSFYTMVGAGGDADRFWGDSLKPVQFLLSGGVAIELCIQLCNQLGIDAWFNIPHRATDEYIEQFARLVKARLDPRLKVYCEYSNEVWNWGFVQSKWMLRSQVAAAPLEAAGANPWVNRDKFEGRDHPERMGVLFRRCFSIWERVFAGAERQRLVTVCAVQHAWLDTAQRTLKYCMQHGGADALAPAGYFGPGKVEYAHWATRGAALTADEVVADLNVTFERDTAKWTRDSAALAKSFGVKYLVYEGGQHVQPEGQKEAPYMPALAAAQKHVGMYELYKRNFALHQEVGCSLFCAFSSVGRRGTRYGSWGHAEHYGQPLEETPKLRALLETNTPRRSIAKS
jgi:hypothetical protein